ncbi:hypothetical protein BJY24_004922 [Nocardia transvalensis]|uniref:Dialkylrecorsinol condensing enzyme n=1 Tax=Nocardia transvalensis TaxID=37333 RepID=A0A7W9PH69_9NOCA|nr:hypothetical protein [Nocardia transvalensis]MBB5916010.1 hypothetical protein [Nocardia transvalensis]
MESQNSHDTAAVRRAVVFHYSQTGQLTETVEAFIQPLRAAGWEIRRVDVAPVHPYPFPWSLRRFFGIFPDCVDPTAAIDLRTPPEELTTDPSELVILGYQIWFLAPSLPIRTLLNRGPHLVAGRNVLSVIACRNMWYSAALEVHRRLGRLGARHLGAVVATDTRPQFVTIASTLRWLLHGKRDGAVLGRAGVSEAELERIRECATAFATGDAPVTGARTVHPIAAADRTAGYLFRRWGALIRAVSSRRSVSALVLTAFVCWLTGAVVAMPLIALLALPWRRRIDRATDAALAPLTRIRRPTTETARVVPGFTLRSGDHELAAAELTTAGLALLYCAASGHTWQDAVGYVAMMDTTPITGIPVSRGGDPGEPCYRDPEGAVFDTYGLARGVAVLLRQSGDVVSVLPGNDPYRELIGAVSDQPRPLSSEQS